MKKYWTRETILKEISEKIDLLQRFPRYRELSYGLRNSISKRCEKLSDYKYLFKQEDSRKPHGYWSEWNNLEKEIKDLIDKNCGIFPTTLQMEENIGGDILKALRKHGGIFKVAKKMNYDYCERSNFAIETTDGHIVLSSYEYLLDEFLYSRGIEHDVGGFINLNYDYRYDFKINDFYIEIWGISKKDTKYKRHIEYNKKRGLKEQIYRDLGLNLISIEFYLFKKTNEEIFKEFESIICDHIKLNKKQIRDINLKNFKEKCFYWTNDRMAKELKVIIDQFGHFPTKRELKNMNKGGLADAIERNGGFKFWSYNIVTI